MDEFSKVCYCYTYIGEIEEYIRGYGRNKDCGHTNKIDQREGQSYHWKCVP